MTTIDISATFGRPTPRIALAVPSFIPTLIRRHRERACSSSCPGCHPTSSAMPDSTPTRFTARWKAPGTRSIPGAIATAERRPAQADRVMRVMLAMTRIEVAKLKAAARG